MKLLNFRLAEPTHGIELVRDDRIWDLHNCCDLASVEYDVERSVASLRWSHLGTAQSGCGPHLAGQFVLVFRGVRTLAVTSAADTSGEESTTLDTVSQVR